MADEITLNLTFRVNSSGSYDKTFQFNESFDQTGQGGGNPGKVNIGTSEENITIGDITTEGWVVMQNLDTTNFVTVGVSATTPTLAAMMKIKAGELAVFRMDPAATLRAQADTAAVELQVWVFED